MNDVQKIAIFLAALDKAKADPQTALGLVDPFEAGLFISALNAVARLTLASIGPHEREERWEKVMQQRGWTRCVVTWSPMVDKGMDNEAIVAELLTIESLTWRQLLPHAHATLLSLNEAEQREKIRAWLTASQRKPVLALGRVSHFHAERYLMTFHDLCQSLGLLAEGFTPPTLAPDLSEAEAVKALFEAALAQWPV